MDRTMGLRVNVMMGRRRPCLSECKSLDTFDQSGNLAHHLSEFGDIDPLQTPLPSQQ